MIKEFKEFISQGNVLDLAVGVILGGAFTAIVDALVNNIFMPIIGMILGGIDFSSLSITIGNAELQYGAFIQAVVNFLLIALCLFAVIKVINGFKRVQKAQEDAAEEAEAPSEEVKLLTEIRDSLKK